jgi:LmbE family N-acetylglucosaminyl deacetylase
MREIAAAVENIGANAMFVTWRHDPHCDHQACYQMARAVQRSKPSISLHEYTVWGAMLPPQTPIEPTQIGFRLDIERQRDRKRRAIAAHRSQTTDLIKDDPDGFSFRPAELARFDLSYETFFESVG